MSPTPGIVAGLAVTAALLAGCAATDRPESPIESTAPPSPDAAQALVAPGCTAYTKKYATGAGSVARLAEQPVAEAIQDHPMLHQFAAAVSGELNERVDLTEELGAGDLTIFAPTDDAFSAKVPTQWKRTLAEPRSADALTELLRFHVIQGERGPHELPDQLRTGDRERLEIDRDGDRIRIADQANVVCGGLRTTDATIYLIDSVLMPRAQATPSPEAGTPTP